MKTAMIKKIVPTSVHQSTRGNANLNHFVQGIPPMARTDMSTPEKGVIILVIPSPSLKASTVVCRVSPIISPIGLMIGITIDACPLPELTSILKNQLNANNS